MIAELIERVSATFADPAVWVAIAALLCLGGILAFVGASIGRLVGVIEPDAPDGEVLAVGLSIGLAFTAGAVATITSRGMSAFTPVTVAMACALALALRTKRDRVTTPLMAPVGPRAALGAAAFVVGVALLYAVTLAPSPSNGLRPIEFMDEAFYSVLGRDLMATGTEAFYSPSGLATTPSLPAQNWYHWGEIWLTGAVDLVPGVTLSFARHLVVLPLLLAATAGLTGSIVRRATRTRGIGALVFGVAASLLLAPVPIVANYFSAWASGMAFSITMYGLAAVIVAFGMWIVTAGRQPTTSAAQNLFVAAIAAMLLPAHVGMAALATGGAVVALAVGGAAVWRDGGSVLSQGHRVGSTIALTGALLAATLLWGVVTGHALLGSGAAAGVDPFNTIWSVAVTSTAIGGVTFLSIPVATVLGWRDRRGFSLLLVAVMAIVGAGAFAWGLRLAEFTMFHVFFGAIAVFGTPAAAASIVVVSKWLRAQDHGFLAAAVMGVAVLQLVIGVFSSGVKLVQFGPRDYPPIPVPVLDAIAALEPNAKVAYACRKSEEVAYWDPRLLMIDMHTGRRVVPLCHQDDALGPLIGGEAGAQSPQFRYAPQAALFSSAGARPSEDEVLEFMDRNGIAYILEDAVHPNTLVPGAVPVITVGDTTLFRIP